MCICTINIGNGQFYMSHICKTYMFLFSHNINDCIVCVAQLICVVCMRVGALCALSLCGSNLCGLWWRRWGWLHTPVTDLLVIPVTSLLPPNLRLLPPLCHTAHLPHRLLACLPGLPCIWRHHLNLLPPFNLSCNRLL